MPTPSQTIFPQPEVAGVGTTTSVTMLFNYHRPRMISEIAALDPKDCEKEKNTMQPQIQLTFLDLVHALTSFIDNDWEVVALATFLVNSGRVRLCGNFAGATIELSLPYSTDRQPHILRS